jgi:gliding motility-associated-like protein
MDSNFTNIDEAFKNAFEHAEPNFSKAEMHADWTKVANQIPAGPVPHSPAPNHVVNHFSGSLGKIIGLSGLGAATVVAIVILYNSYGHNPAQTAIQNKAVADKTFAQPQPQYSDSRNNLTLQPQATKPEKNDSKKTGKRQVLDFPLNDKKEALFGNPFSPMSNPEKRQIENKVNARTPDNVLKTNNPRPKLNLSASLICAKQALSVSTNLSGNTLTIEWGDGYTEPMNGTLVHSFFRPGHYNMHVSGSGISLDTLITAVEKPKAGFAIRQTDKLTFNFSNQSIQAGKYIWIYDDGSADENSYYASHTFPDTGRHVVRLVAYNTGGCTDTFSQFINVNEFTEPVVSSNFITPNGDNKNDDFYVVIQNETSYQLTIVDNTGTIVFDANNKNKHWDGRNQFTGSDCKPGAYYYSISYSYKLNDEPRLKHGTVTLFR